MPLFSRKCMGGAKPTRLFYACDIHGSEPTYRKFLNGATWRASLQGQQHHLTSEESLSEFKRTMQTLGFYWQEMEPDEYAEYEGNQDRIDRLFDVLAKERLKEWVALAEERLAGADVQGYLCGGGGGTPAGVCGHPTAGRRAGG